MTVDEFNQYRPLLFSIAYRMLGVVADAEDILQEAYLRIQAHTTMPLLNGQPAILAHCGDQRLYFAMFLYGEASQIHLIHVVAGQKLVALAAQLEVPLTNQWKEIDGNSRRSAAFGPCPARNTGRGRTDCLWGA